MCTYRFKLYIAGYTPQAISSINTIKNVAREFFFNNYSLDIVNILTDKEQAHAANILYTPCLVKEQPHPQDKIIGEVTREKLLALLEIEQ